RARAGERVAYVSIHWDSERVLFHESAVAAVALGRSRIAQVLESIRQGVPHTKLTVIGHSLGARLMISALDASAGRFVEGALLVEGAADADWLHDGYVKTCARVG